MKFGKNISLDKNSAAAKELKNLLPCRNFENKMPGAFFLM